MGDGVRITRRRFLKGLGALALFSGGVDVYEDGEFDANAYRGTPGDYIVPGNETVQRIAADTTLHEKPFDDVFEGTYRVPKGLAGEPDALYLGVPDAITFETANDTMRYGELDHWQKTGEYLENGAVGDCGEYVNATLSLLGAKGHAVQAVRGFPVKDVMNGALLAPLHLVGEVVIDEEVYVLDDTTPRWLWPRDRYEEWAGETYGWKPHDMYGEGEDWEPYDADWPRSTAE